MSTVAYLSTPSTSDMDQRSQLLRSPGKFGQTVGPSPYLVDNRHVGVTVRIDLPLKNPKHEDDHAQYYDDADEETGEISAFQMMPALARTDTNASASSMESCSSYASEEGVPEIAHVEVRVLRSRRNRGPNGNPNPSLRIESASSAPSSLSAPYQHHPSEGASSHHTIRPTAVRPDSIVDRPHTFAVQSDASYRRDKLERLRRRLGDGVPVNMVFPSETDLVHAQDVDSNEQNRSGARRRRALWF